jgi:hypothetical protein
LIEEKKTVNPFIKNIFYQRFYCKNSIKIKSLLNK